MTLAPHQLPTAAFSPDPGADAATRSALALEYIAAMLFRLDAKITDIGSAVGNPGTAGGPIKGALAEACRQLAEIASPRR